MPKLTFDSRTKFVLLTFLSSIGTYLNIWLKWGWVMATLLTLGVGALYVWYIVKNRDTLLFRLALFGLAAGFIELQADCWGEANGGLVYYPGGPFIMCSPLYMPFSWALLMLQIGYVGWWLATEWGLLPATIVATLLGAINIPSYEYAAKSSLLWYYQNVNMLWGIVPYYVIFAEAAICAVLPVTLVWLLKQKWWVSPLVGVVQGYWMWGAGVLGFMIFH